jgi:hypothetical protein
VRREKASERIDPFGNRTRFGKKRKEKKETSPDNNT